MNRGLLSFLAQVFPVALRAPVAQRTEQGPSKPEAAGSIPAGGTSAGRRAGVWS